MSIRRRLARTLATVTLVFAVLATGVAAMGSWRGFVTVEDAGADLDAERVVQALGREADALARSAEDWSFWDDTLDYVRGEDPDYAGSNLVPDTLTILGLDDLLIADATGQVVWSAGLSPDGDAFVEADPALAPAVRPGGDLHPTDLDGGGAGVRRLDHGLAIVAHQPISDSEGSVPAAGTLVMVRHLDGAVVDGLAASVQRAVAVEPYDPAAPTRERTSGAVVSRVPLGDPEAPLGTLAVTTPRDVSAVGRSTILWMAGALMVLLLMLGAVALAVVDRTVVRRLVRLRDDASAIGRAGSGGVHDDGRGDELNDLVHAVNHMVASLSRTRQDLELRNAELAELASVRQDLVAMFSHELRTPLTALLGFAQTLRDHGDELQDAERRRFLLRIEANARHLNRLVGDLLVLSRADDSAVMTTPEVVQVATVLDELASDLGVTLSTHVEPSTRAICDRDHLRRMLGNLVENARRYGAQPIEVHAVAEGDRVRLTVRDHGPGIPDGFAPRLFERFTQASTGDTRTSQGVGLGLAIVSLLATANGGDVRHVPSPVGAEFEVRLPAPDPEAADAVPDPGQAPRAASPSRTNSTGATPPTQAPTSA